MSFPTWSDLNSPSLVPPLGARKAPDVGPLAVMVSTEPDVRLIKKCLDRPRSRSFFMGQLFHGTPPARVVPPTGVSPIMQGQTHLPNEQPPTPSFSGVDSGAEISCSGLESKGPEIGPAAPDADVEVKTGPCATGDGRTLSPVFAGPYIGSPYAVMLLESLIARGAREILVVGWCGALSPALGIGDVLVPHSAIAHEGTSGNYMESTGTLPVVPAPSDMSREEGLSARVHSSLRHAGIACKTGQVWTTDAIYRETAEKVDYFRERGAMAVEMECSALFAAAAYRRVELTAVLVVSDVLTDGRWRPAFKSKPFTAGRKAVAEWVCRFTDK